MNCAPPKTIICDEIFDENFVPSEKDIIDYALKIGIDPTTEKQLLPIAKDGLMQPLPKEWKPCMVESTGSYYYFNLITGESQWHHPLDDYYKELVKKKRTDYNTRTGEEDLKSFEGHVDLPENKFSSKTQDLADNISMSKPPHKLKSLGRPPLPPKRGPSAPSNVQLSAPGKDKSRIDIDSMPLFGASIVQQGNTPALARTPPTIGLKIKGEGSMFLKSNQKQSPSPTKDSQSSLVIHSKLDLLKEPESLESLDSDKVDDVPSKLWDMDPSYMSSVEKMRLRNQDLEEDRRRSVRFADFEKKSLDLDIRFHIPDSEETTSSNSFDQQEDNHNVNNDIQQITDVKRNINKGGIAQTKQKVKQNLAETCVDNNSKIDSVYNFSGKGSGDSNQLYIKEANLNKKAKDDIINSLKINNNVSQLLPTDISDNVNIENSLSDRQRLEKENTSSSVRAYINRGNIIKSALDYFLNDNLTANTALTEDREIIVERSQLKRSISDNSAFNVDKYYERSPRGAHSMRDSNECLDISDSNEKRKVKHMPEVDLNKVFKNMRDVLINSSEHSEVEEDNLEFNLITSLDNDRLDQKELEDSGEEKNAIRVDSNVDDKLEEVDVIRKEKEEQNIKLVEVEISRLKKEQEEKLSQIMLDASNTELFQKQRIVKDMQNEIDRMRFEIEKERQERETELRTDMEQQLEAYLQQLDKQKAAKLREIKENHDVFVKEQEEKVKEEEKKVEEATDARVQSSVETLAKFVEEIKEREEKEMLRLEKESEERIKEIKHNNEKKQAELEEKHKQELAIIDAQLERTYAERQALLEAVIAEQETVHETVIQKAQEQQQAKFEQFWAQCQQEEEFMKKKHAEKMEEITNQLKASEKEDICREFEKVRCEKRLLEDKYRTLKEKYVRLKNEVRLSMERKRQTKLNRQLQRDATSTTEETTDHSKPPSGRQHNRKPAQTEDAFVENGITTSKTMKRKTPTSVTTTTSDSTPTPVPSRPKNVWYPSPLQRREGANNADTSSADDNHTSVSESMMEHDQPGDKHTAIGPIDSLRKQLEKLEELEEQFPPSTHIDTYLRYPFSGPAGASSELEFYRHKLHLERESVRRAKQALAEQKMQLQHKKTNICLQQEERELTDMEVSLHRTQALLGEKIIRLRYLEQSLERATAHHSPINTLSEPLGTTDSSGFSGSDLDLSSSGVHLGGLHTTTSFNVLQSLDSINSEIREIWAILGKQQIPGTGLGPPPLLQYNDTSRAPRRAVDIAERTRGLKDWLVQARDHHTTHQKQVTL